VIIGSEVGTSLKTLVAGINGSGEKKRAAFGNFYFNVATVILAFVFLRFIIYFITGIVGIQDPLIGLAFFQSLINLIAIIVFLPFIDIYAKWLQKQFMRDDAEESYITKQFLHAEDPDPQMLKEEVMNLQDKNLEFHDRVMDVNISQHEGFIENVRSFARKSGYTNKVYNRLKISAGELLDFHARVREDKLTPAENAKMDLCMEALRQIMHSAKSVKDIHHNITDLRETAKDILHDHYHRIQQDWIVFKNDFLVSKHDRNFLDKLMHKAHTDMNVHNELIQAGLKNRMLDEVEASTLLNIEREMLSSKKALIRAAETML
jgi:phosphate:Na+ symporter